MEGQPVGRKEPFFPIYCSPNWAPHLGLEALLSSDPKRAWLGKFLTAALSPTWRTKGFLRHRNRSLQHGCASPECPKGEQLLMLEQRVPWLPSGAIEHLQIWFRLSKEHCTLYITLKSNNNKKNKSNKLLKCFLHCLKIQLRNSALGNLGSVPKHFLPMFQFQK